MKKQKLKLDLTSPKIKAIILSIVIAIILSAFVIYLIQSIYSKPKYEDYCEERIKAIPLDENQEITQEICEANNGKWTLQDIRCITTPCPQGYCDYNYKCNKEYETAGDKYKLVVFTVAVIAGLIAVSVGIILSLPSVSVGLMVGGAFLMFYGTVIYWSNLTNWLRTIVLASILAILIWLGYKKLKN